MRVLFPLDGSERGFASMEAALALLQPKQVEATLLVVLTDFKGAPEEMVAAFEEDTEDEVFPTEESAVVVLKQATKRLRRQGLKMKLKIAKGDILNEIIAESAHHDLLVVHAARSRPWYKPRSNRTKTLLRRAQCHVLLVRSA